MRRVVIAVGLLIAAVVTTWLLLPRQAAIDCESIRFAEPPTVRLQGNVLTVSFHGNRGVSRVNELFGQIPENGGASLAARLRLEQPLEPGTHTIEGTAQGSDASDWTFTPAPAHSPRVTSVGLKLFYSGDLPETGKQTVRGTLRIDLASAAQLKGRLDLQASGEVGCPGTARLSTRFVVKPERE